MKACGDCGMCCKLLSIEALAERFGVTLQTVRRDVKLLAEAGLG